MTISMFSFKPGIHKGLTITYQMASVLCDLAIIYLRQGHSAIHSQGDARAELSPTSKS